MTIRRFGIVLVILVVADQLIAAAIPRQKTKRDDKKEKEGTENDKNGLENDKIDKGK